MQVLTAIDMPKGFVAGALAGGRHAGGSTLAPRSPIEHARARPDRPVVHPADAHQKADPEIAARGRHAMAGTPGAGVVARLSPIGGEREVVAPERHGGACDGGACDGTALDESSRRRGVAPAAAAGQHTHRRVRPAACGASVRGPRAAVPSRSDPSRQAATPKGVAEGGAACVLDGVDQAALDDPRRMCRMYGATIAAADLADAGTGGGATDRAEAAR